MKTLREITDREVFEFFKKHIGYRKAASLREVSFKLFGHRLNLDNRLEIEGMIRLVSTLVSKYRSNKKLFIIKRDCRYYVPDSEYDIRYFEKIIIGIIEGMRENHAYLKKFVEDKEYKTFHKEPLVIER